MDAGLEGRIEGFDAVGGQKEYTLEVFKQSKEDADKSIPGNVLGLTSLCVFTLAEFFILISHKPYPERRLPRLATKPHPKSERHQESY